MTPRSRITWLYGNSVFNLLRNCQLFSKWATSFYIPTSYVLVFWFPTCLPTLVIFDFYIYGYPSGCGHSHWTNTHLKIIVRIKLSDKTFGILHCSDAFTCVGWFKLKLDLNNRLFFLKLVQKENHKTQLWLIMWQASRSVRYQGFGYPILHFKDVILNIVSV